MPARFDKLGISFQYPENWTLDDSDALLGRKSVTVYSPAGAFWTVAIHPGSADPPKLAAAVLDAMKKEYPGLEIDEAFETIAGHDLIGYDVSFYYLDLINTAVIRSLRVGQTCYMIFCQAEDRDFDQLRMVFQAMTTSLVSGLTDLEYEGWEEDDEGLGIRD
jgi:hypothetical protein